MSIIQLFSSMSAEQAASALREDLNSFVRAELERAFNEALDGEIEDFLAEAANSADGKIYRNGYYERVLKTSYGPLSLRVPRDRMSLFKTQMLKPYQRATSDLEYLVQRLYLEGLTLNEITEHLASDSSLELSRESARRFVAKLAKGAEEFRSRPLPECVVVFMDGTYVPLRRRYGDTSSVAKECVEVAIGVTKDGRRQVLDFRSVPQEGAGNWSEFLESIKTRGIGSPKLFVTDGLQGMPEAIAKWFPESKRQLCLVHVQRNISQATRMRDRKEIMDDFKAVYTKGSRKECDEAFEAFASKWSKPYPKLISSLLGKADSMFRFYEFPKAMWKSIYTSNAAESLNATAKRKTRARIQYNSEDSALIVLAKVYEDYNRNARPARFMLEMSEEEKKEMGFSV